MQRRSRSNEGEALAFCQNVMANVAEVVVIGYLAEEIHSGLNAICVGVNLETF